MGRKVSGKLTGGRVPTRSATARSATARSATARSAFGAARETIRFTRDVREGMDLYIARHNGSAPPTLGTPDASKAYRANDQKDGH
jgi:hypothetical protein